MLAYAAVKDGNKWTPAKKKEKPIKAIHIEVQKSNISKAKNMFSVIYGSSAKTFPLSIKMRYVPSILPSTNTRTKRQIQDLRKKQEWYIASITHAQTWDIQHLDKVIDPNTKSLRELMTAFKTKDKESPLFLGNNKDKRGDGYFVTFPTINKTETRDMLSHFGSYLVYEQKNKEVLQYLTMEAGERASKAKWDPETQTAISEENTTMDELINKTDNMDWLQGPVQQKGVQFTNNVAPVLTSEQQYASNFRFNQDTSLINTFSSRYTPLVSPSKTKDIEVRDYRQDQISKMSPEETVATLSVKFCTKCGSLSDDKL